MFALCQISKKYQEQALNFFSFLIQMSQKQNTEKLLKTKVLNVESETFQKGFLFLLWSKWVKCFLETKFHLEFRSKLTLMSFGKFKYSVKSIPLTFTLK